MRLQRMYSTQQYTQNSTHTQSETTENKVQVCNTNLYHDPTTIINIPTRCANSPSKKALQFNRPQVTAY